MPLVRAEITDGHSKVSDHSLDPHMQVRYEIFKSNKTNK